MKPMHAYSPMAWTAPAKPCVFWSTKPRASNAPNIEVSWQVTGIRQDAWAQKNRIPNSVDKPAAEKGKLLHPEAFDKPAEQGAYATPAANGQSVGK